MILKCLSSGIRKWNDIQSGAQRLAQPSAISTLYELSMFYGGKISTFLLPSTLIQSIILTPRKDGSMWTGKGLVDRCHLMNCVTFLPDNYITIKTCVFILKTGALQTESPFHFIKATLNAFKRESEKVETKFWSEIQWI